MWRCGRALVVCRLTGAVWLGVWLLAGVAGGEVVTLKNGMKVEGRVTREGSLNQNPLLPFKGAGNVNVTKIVLVDDGLRRTFFSSNQVRAGGLAADADVVTTTIHIPKRVAKVGRRIGSVGPILQVTPFDEFGNRIFSMQSERGRLDVVQGITEINPLYCKVEGLLVKNALIWDMRINTSSIPRDVLTKILLRQIDQTDPQDRLRVVTLYMQAKRYQDALAELDRVIHDFPDLKDVKDQRQRLYQLVTTDVIREIELRKRAGQHRQAYQLLKTFPPKDVAGELLLKVSDMLKEYEDVQARGKKILDMLAGDVAALKDHKSSEQIAGIVQEIQEQLNINNIDRMADYVRLWDDEKLTTEQKMSLAISGWLLGAGAGIENLAETLSLVEVRVAVRDYLRSENQIQRDDILERLRGLEGSSPSNLAKIIAQMKPPLEVEFPQEGVPGLLQRAIPGVGDEPEFRYYVQVPPEYDPSRRYPCIVTLHGGGSTALGQIDWWAGAYDRDKHLRKGQATRRGYFVIAPEWAKENQIRYQYSLREHAAVLGALRDACQRFSIDTDRVFLSGHSMGGDAAWDIGLAHPDLWAGVLPVTARADKYVSRYWPNGRGLPMYFVAGQLDGNKIADNSRDLDRYLRYAGFDVMYVEYQGRGHGHFLDEIQRMFEWMELYRRDFARREFEAVAMRPWDQFFWWVELAGFPERSVVLPANWPQPKVRDTTTEARITENNSIRVKSAATRVTVWLSPDLVDFDRRISLDGRRVEVTPNVEVLLEDVRTRGDRQHPFWATVSQSRERRR